MILSINLLLFPKQIMIAMPSNEGVSHFASLVKYAVTFWDVPLPGHAGQFVLQWPDFRILAGIP